MNQAMEFVETSVFTRQIDELATDDELRVLQAELIGQPDKGSLIKGSGGLRKVRMTTANAGKSGSIRVIYYWRHAQRIYLLLAYPKSQRDTLSASELDVLKALARQLKGEKP